ncbi:MAG: hypothetical protein R3B13_20220 [Polyangiaceae bacterium]
MKRLLSLALLLVAGLNTPRDVDACGGPDYGNFGALESLNSNFWALTMPDPEWAEWANAKIPELRFLYPFRAQAPLAWKLTHETLDHAPAPSQAGLDDAISRDDLGAIDREARRVIDAVLDMPAPLATEHSAALWRAVELVELGPALKAASRNQRRDFFQNQTGAPLPASLKKAVDARSAEPGPNGKPVAFTRTHPREASLSLWAAMRDVRTKIPNGYRRAIQQQVPAATFKSLRDAFVRWRAAHPKHPLVDLARLSELRVAYLQGDAAGAWQALIDVYPRHLGRVVYEMRYLRVQGVEPTATQVDAITEPLLVAALANDATVTTARWQKWWQLAARAPNRRNLKERLLAWSARHGGMQAQLPRDARTISPLAAKLTAVAWMRAGKPDLARSQLEKIPSDAMQAQLLVKAHLSNGKLEQAAQVKGISGEVRRYLVRARVSTPGLERLVKSKDAELALDARIELATRLARQDKWRQAARLMDRVDPNRAGLLRKAGTLAQQGKWLELARFFESNSGQLFFGEESSFYRGISSHWESLPKGSKEARQIQAALTRSTERWLALEAYTRWLEANPADPNARAALAEADQVYSRLTNYGGGDWFFWGKYQKQSPTIRRLREVGKVIRQRSGG